MNPVLLEERLDLMETWDEASHEVCQGDWSDESLSQASSQSFTIQQYMREVNNIPLMSHQEMVEVFRKIEARTRFLRESEASGTLDPTVRSTVERELSELKQKVITANLRLVVFLANRYQGRGVSIQDLVQEGNIGLMKAVDKFDYKMGYKFSTYATWWIRQAMLRAIQQYGRLIRIPTHMLEKLQAHTRKASEAQGDELEIPEEAGWEEDGLDEAHMEEDSEMIMLREVMRDPLSLDAPMTEDGLDLQEVTSDENYVLPDDKVITEDLIRKVREAMKSLPTRDEVILRLRFGIDLPNSYTLEEVGKLFGLTKERIRQIEARALKKLAFLAN